ASPLIYAAVSEVTYDSRPPVQAVDQFGPRRCRAERAPIDLRNVYVRRNQAAYLNQRAVKIDAVIQIGHQQHILRSQRAVVAYYLVDDSRNLIRGAHRQPPEGDFRKPVSVKVGQPFVAYGLHQQRIDERTR